MAAEKYWFHIGIESALGGLILLLVALSAAAGGNEVSDHDPRAAYLADSRTRLSDRLDALAVYSARFTQDVFGARGELLERSQGQVLLQRPDFKWVVDAPYPQVIVTEGDQLKVYDPDLQQLTIRPLDEALSDTPVSILTRDDVIIGDRFHVARIADELGEAYVIQPASEETLYREIRLQFDSRGLTGLDILDHVGQRTEIRFSPDPAVSMIDSAEFVLEVPPDTDVIGG